jgi:hypothetical protein
MQIRKIGQIQPTAENRRGTGRQGHFRWQKLQIPIQTFMMINTKGLLFSTMNFVPWTGFVYVEWVCAYVKEKYEFAMFK